MCVNAVKKKTNVEKNKQTNISIIADGKANRTGPIQRFNSNRIKYINIRTASNIWCIYIYKYRDGPRGVIWNLVVRASFFNVFFTINSKSHVFDMIFSASILTFSCGSNGMGPNILFSAICEVRGGSIFQKACFLEIKEYALNTSLKKRTIPIEIVEIDIWMII